MKHPSATASGIALTTAILLAGCGGGGGSASGPVPASTTVGGTVSGVPAGTVLLMVNNGSDIVMAGATSTFTFDDKIQSGAQYKATLFDQPSGLYCTIANAQGMIDQNADPVTNINVSCQTAPVALPFYNVGVLVSGLAAGNSVTFQLYGSDPLTVNANGLAVFSQALSTDQVLPPWPAVTISANPTGQTCTIAGNPGTRTDISNFVEVGVTCQ